MEPIYGGVWIDHASARIVEVMNGRPPQFIALLSQVESHLRSTGKSGMTPPGHVGGNRESHYHNRREGQLHRFYDQVIEKLMNCDAIVIMGPEGAKRELLDRMEGTRGFRALILRTETTSRLSDGQILERVRRGVTSTPVHASKDRP